MIKEAKVFSRMDMENILRFPKVKENFPYRNRPWFLVSIHSDPSEEFLVDHKRRALEEGVGMVDGLSICFWDITPKSMEDNRYKDAILFDENHAKAIFEFIKKANEVEDAVLVAHCDAGISRSGAVGTFTVDYCQLDYKEFISNNMRVMANDHVLKLLRKAADMTPSFGTHDGVGHWSLEDGVYLPKEQ
jgi:predicted protein tyrosine phosphatase